MLHAIADHVVDRYHSRTLTDSEDDIDAVETEVFSRPQGQPRRGTDAGRIYQLKREVLEFKRAGGPAAAPYATAQSSGPIQPIDPEIQPFTSATSSRPPVARPASRSSPSTNCSTRILQANLRARSSVGAERVDMRKITSWAAIIGGAHADQVASTA